MILNKLVMVGCPGVGKTSIRSVMFHAGTNLHMLAPTEDVTHSSAAFLNHLISIKDYGSAAEGMKHQLQRGTYIDTNKVMFFFNAAKQDQTEDLEHFRRVMHLLNETSSSAQVFVILHRSDLVKGREKEILNAMEIKIVREMEKSKIQLKNDVQLFLTSAYNPGSVFNAWRSIFLTFELPDGWKDRLHHFGKSMDYDQLMVFDNRHGILVANVVINKKYDTFTDEQGEDEFNDWLINSCNDDRLAEQVNNKRIYVHCCNYNTYLVVIADNPTVTSRSVAVNNELFKESEYLLSCRKEGRWNCPFELDYDYHIKDKEVTNKMDYYRVPEDWKPTLRMIAESMGLDQIILLDKYYRVIIVNEVINVENCIENIGWDDVTEWLWPFYHEREYKKGGKKIFSWDFSTETVLIMITNKEDLDSFTIGKCMEWIPKFFEGDVAFQRNLRC